MCDPDSSNCRETMASTPPLQLLAAASPNEDDVDVDDDDGGISVGVPSNFDGNTIRRVGVCNCELTVNPRTGKSGEVFNTPR